MEPYATSDLLRKLSAVKLSGGLGSWESARLRANRAEHGRRVRNRVNLVLWGGEVHGPRCG
jgi:hypothetical protein